MNKALNGKRSETAQSFLQDCEGDGRTLCKQLPEACVAVEAQIGAETLRNKHKVGSNVLPLYVRGKEHPSMGALRSLCVHYRGAAQQRSVERGAKAPAQPC